MKSKLLVLIVGVLTILATVMAGCATTPGGTNSANSQPTGSAAASTGSLEVRVTDAPAKPNVTAVLVTVASVEVHAAGGAAPASITPSASANVTDDGGAGNDNSGWITLQMSGPATFDLLQVKDLEQLLATANLAPGTYTQVRMAVTKVEVTLDGKTVVAKIPSGKLKFVQPFEVAAGKTTVLLFDFDAANSVVVTGNDKVMFKPVIKLNVTKNAGKMQITTEDLPNGEVGIPYNATLSAIGGTAPYLWSVADGTLSPGVTLTGDTLAGTPTTAGQYTFTLKVVDSAVTGQKDDSRRYTVAIAAAGTLLVTTTALPDGVKNAAYTAQLQAVGGTAPYQWAIDKGNLPAGVTLDSATGQIAGTPTADGNVKITVKVSDAASPSNTATQELTIKIAPEVATN